MNKTMQAFLVIFTSLVLGGSIGLLSEDTMNFHGILPTPKEIEEAAKIPAKKEELGKMLLSLFSDKNQPPKKRIECALALGRVKYLPAIPKLVEFIDLTDPERISSEANIEEWYPCVRALAEYGQEAIPNVVEAYAKESNKKRQDLLYFVIKVGKTSDTAIAFAKKNLSEKADETTQARLKALIDELMKK